MDTTELGDRELFRNYIPISFLVHLLLIGIVGITVSQREPYVMPLQPIILEFDPISDKNKRVVQSTSGQLIETPAPDAFLGKENRRVRDQTMAQPKVGELVPGRRVQPRVALKNLGVSMTGRQAIVRKDFPQWMDQGERQAGKNAAQDYVKGMKEANTTALNTKEFIYFGYFQRIRKQLDQAWTPLLRKKLFKMYKRGRSPASEMEHITKTLVTLNAAGEIIRVQVVGESGTQDLDQAAVQAFNKAGPFPNPPRGLIGRRGKIEIRWDFILRT